MDLGTIDGYEPQKRFEEDWSFHTWLYLGARVTYIQIQLNNVCFLIPSNIPLTLETHISRYAYRPVVQSSQVEDDPATTARSSECTAFSQLNLFQCPSRCWAFICWLGVSFLVGWIQKVADGFFKIF